MMNRTPSPPRSVRWVARTLQEAGHETWAVGGAIRNTLLGIASGDWDLATSARPEVVRRLFPRTVPVGVEHGTVGILTREGTLLEITTFRRDVETFGRHAVVEFADTLEEDLSRRDFTVNAIAFHPLRQEFRDPFGGRADLAAGLLRTVGDPRSRFAEDYLRVLRGLRFSGRFRLRIDAATWNALCAATSHLGILSAERIREELLKVLSQQERPSGTLNLYQAAGVLAAVYPELAALEGAARPGGSEDLWVHSVLFTDLVPMSRPLERVVALLHGLGVPVGGQDEYPDPALRGRDRAAALMIRLRFSNAEVREVTELVGAGPEAPTSLKDPAQIRKWLHRTGLEWVPGLARLWLGKARLDRLRWGADPGPTLELIRRLRAVLRRQPPLRTEDLALNGRDLIALGLKPGPQFGVILEALMQHVLEDPSLNLKDRLVELVGTVLEDVR